MLKHTRRKLKMKRATLLLPLFFFSFSVLANVDSREINCLAKNIYFEARGETSTGMAAVGQVTRNRVNSGSYPDSYCRVIYQKDQFSWTRHKPKVDYSDKSWQQAKVIAAYTYYVGWPYDLVENATHFHSGKSAEWTKKLHKVKSLGNHKFYRG